LNYHFRQKSDIEKAILAALVQDQRNYEDNRISDLLKKSKEAKKRHQKARIAREEARKKNK
jgi:hypothetical protein